MRKLFLLSMIIIYGSLSVAMQPPKVEYNRKATDTLYGILNRDGFSDMKPEEIKKVLGYIKTLIEAGANPDIRPANFYTPLFFAIHYDESLIPLLLQRGASPYWMNFPKMFPLEFAIQQGKAEAVRLLLAAGADVKRGYYGNETPITFAVRYSEDLIPLLIKHGADFKSKRLITLQPPVLPQAGQRNIDPLALAIMLGKSNAAKLLMEAGADVNQTYPGGSTPLMLAAARDQRGIVEMLIEHGALKSKDQRNTRGETAWDIAHRNGYLEVEKLLKPQKLP